MKTLAAFRTMARMLDKIAAKLAAAAAHSGENLRRPEMDFAELIAHLRQLGGLYRQELAYKAYITHRTFSVRKIAKRLARPLSEKRLAQLREAGRKGGSHTGSPKKALAAKANATKRWGRTPRIVRPQKGAKPGAGMREDAKA